VAVIPRESGYRDGQEGVSYNTKPDCSNCFEEVQSQIRECGETFPDAK
jgi:hypothetical protein